MPELSRFNGMSVKMFFNDAEQHHKPHVHVYYGDDEASVAIDGEVLSGRIPDRQYRLLSGWLALREDELYKAWNQAVRNLTIEKIAPLQ